MDTGSVVSVAVLFAHQHGGGVLRACVGIDGACSEQFAPSEELSWTHLDLPDCSALGGVARYDALHLLEPSLVARLEEAGVDPAPFIPVFWK